MNELIVYANSMLNIFLKVYDDHLHNSSNLYLLLSGYHDQFYGHCNNEWLDELERAIRATNEYKDQLLERIHPVLRVTVPEPMADEKAEEIRALVPLAERLRNLCWESGKINDELRVTIDRMEL